ncbi:MAG TPA: DoxX family membrane protein [Nakamurella sp.]|jgi:putative oxidoreductase
MKRSRSQVDIGLLLLRLGVGATLIGHGTQKLFGWFGGHGLTGTATGMEHMGFQPAKASAVAAGLGEAGGGALLLLGLATPVGGAAVAATMASAATVHAEGGFFATEGGWEYTAVLGVAGTALAISGPGRYSLDRLLGHRLNQPWITAAAFAAVTAATIAVQARRRQTLSNTTTPDPTAH